MIKYQYNDTSRPQEVILNKFESIDCSSNNDLIYQNCSPKALNVIRDNYMKIQTRDGLDKTFLERILKMTFPFDNNEKNCLKIDMIKKITFFFKNGNNYLICLETKQEGENTFHDIYQLIFQETFTEEKYLSEIVKYFSNKIPTGKYTFNLGEKDELNNWIPRTMNDIKNVSSQIFTQDDCIYIRTTETMFKLQFFYKIVLKQYNYLGKIITDEIEGERLVCNKYHCSDYLTIPLIKMGCEINTNTDNDITHTYYNADFIFSSGTIVGFPNVYHRRIAFSINEKIKKEFYTFKTYPLIEFPEEFIRRCGGLTKIKKLFADSNWSELDSMSFDFQKIYDLKIYYKTFKETTTDYDIKSVEQFIYDLILIPFKNKKNDNQTHFSLKTVRTNKSKKNDKHEKYGLAIHIREDKEESWLNQSEDFLTAEDTMYVEFDIPNTFERKFQNCHLDCKTSLATTFGQNGNMNQLIVSASSKSTFKNYIFYSQVGNFGYFPIVNYLSIGNSTAAITGFNKTQFGLIIHKDFNENQAYVINFEQTEVEKQLIFAAKLDYIYPSNACVAPYSCENLNESLYLSNIGIQGIVPSKGMNQSIIQVSRGEKINKLLLKEHNIINALAFVFKTFYMLCIENRIYILDMYSQQRNTNFDNVTNDNSAEKYQLSAFYWEFQEIKMIKSISQIESGVILVVTPKDSSNDRIYQIKDTMTHDKSPEDLDASDWYWYTKKFENVGQGQKKQLISTTIKYRGSHKDSFIVELIIDDERKEYIKIEFNEVTSDIISDKEIISNQVFNNLKFIQFRIRNNNPLLTMKRFILLEFSFRYKVRGRYVINNKQIIGDDRGVN